MRIMARSQSIHEYILVLDLKEKDKIVVNEDGINNAPALSKSDVRLSVFDDADNKNRKLMEKLLDEVLVS